MKASCEMESDRQDTELALVRYLTWAIPSLGFIGTVARDRRSPGAGRRSHARQHRAGDGKALE